MTKLGFFSDLHYYSAVLGTEGRAYELREGSDQKCLKETKAILTALCNTMKNNDTDAVVIPGDVTNDGEKESHEEAIALLDDLAAVKPVYVITSTHDWCSDGHARRFEGDEVKDHLNVVTKEEIPALYDHFGKGEEVSRHTTSIGQISKSFVINGEVLLIAVNDDCDADGGKSGFNENSLEWMKQQLDYARENNLCPIAIEHHLLLHNVSPLVNKGQSIGDNFTMAGKLADMGLKLMVTGHSHIQRTSTYTSEAGNTITQLNLGSISGYPGLITYIKVEDGKGYITEAPFEFEYNGETLGTEYLREHSTRILTRIIHSAATDKADFIDVLGANGIRGGWINAAYPFIKKLCRMAETISVGKAAKKVNRLCMKKVIPMDKVESVKDDLLIEHIKDTFLNLFWWGGADKQSDDVKAIVMAVGKLPTEIIRKLPIGKKKEGLLKIGGQIEELVSQLEYPEKNPDFVVLK